MKISKPRDDHSIATEHSLSVTCTAFMNMFLQISSCSHAVKMMVMRMTTMMMRDVIL